MVAAGKLYDLVTPCETAGETDGRHRGLGAAAAHADLADGGHEAGDQFRHLDLERVRRAE